MQNIASDSIGDDLLSGLEPAAPAENDTDVPAAEGETAAEGSRKRTAKGE